MPTADFAPVTSRDELSAVYGAPHGASLTKVATRLTPVYRRLIEASPFFIIASAGPEGLDASPRGDRGDGFRVLDDRTLAIPDWRGNNRVDTLSNIVRDARIALLFLLPGSDTTVRLNGRAIVTLDARLLATSERDGKTPRSAIVIDIGEVYIQCGRAVIRSKLWDPASRIPPEALPTLGEVLADQSAGGMDSLTVDREWSEVGSKTLW